MTNSKQSLKAQALKELAIRELEGRTTTQRESLVSCIEYLFEHELNKPFDSNWHYSVIEEKLKQVLEGKITRLIINIPPGSGKTELITKCFPVWALGNKPDLHIIATGYSTQLTQTFGTQARDYYTSDTFLQIFPRRPKLRDDQNAKGLWVNEMGGRYLATGAGGSITGNRANIFLIDDPIKPDEAQSDVKREAINRWYDNTVVSRLFNPLSDAIIIIMQRTHENDLCGYLEEREKVGGEKWDRLVLPAIATHDEQYRSMGEPLQKNRYPLEALESLRQALGESNFSGQYQQDPVNKEAQYFHEEFFQYYDELPTGMRHFTLVDPAFKTKKENDYTSIMTVGFKEDKLYVLEYSQVKLQASEVIDKIIYHLLKWKSEKVGVESYAAQTVLAQWLKEKMKASNVQVPIEEITQTGDKGFKIRQLDTPIRTGKVFWRRDMHELETQLKKFPRGKHDDVCFIGNTLIATSKGSKPIKDIRVGDLVLTPFGYRKVICSKCTGIYEVSKVVYGSKEVIATSNHPLFVNGKGFVAIDSLRIFDTLSVLSFINLFKWIFLAKLYLKESDIGLWGRKDITYLNQQLMQEGDGLRACMSLFGKMETGGVCRKGLLFITRIVTVLIMSLRIWTLWTGRSTLECICKIGLKTLCNIKRLLRTWTLSGTSRRSGMHHQRVESGIGLTESMVGKIKKYIQWFARCVPLVIKRHFRQEVIHVVPLVDKNGEPDLRKVYSLTVEGAGMYYANGILVSNCDTLQMAYSVYFPKYAKQEGIDIPKVRYDSMGRIIYA